MTNRDKNENGEKELRRQVDEYNTLSIYQSARGQVVLVFSGLYVLSIILGFFGVFPVGDLIWGLIVYIPVVTFVYKGHRWAMIVLIALWALEKAYTSYLTFDGNFGSIWGSVFWFIIVTSMILRALKVENRRIKKSPTNTVHGVYCESCGTKLSEDSKFCVGCGSPL